MQRLSEVVKWGLILTILLTLALVIKVESAEAKERDYTSAVIHHTASHDVSASTINKWHKERGWDGIGYHWVIRANGAIEKGRAMWKQGAHAKGRNHKTGIVLTGYSEFTKEQVKSLHNLLQRLGIKHKEKHHEECPSNGLTDIVRGL
jgi:hypothetical protein